MAPVISFPPAYARTKRARSGGVEIIPPEAQAIDALRISDTSSSPPSYPCTNGVGRVQPVAMPVLPRPSGSVTSELRACSYGRPVACSIINPTTMLSESE